MHLQSLTLKGFKSFASATTLHFEPGITAVVGPNGSGKSNVVDAIAWVLGEQGAKVLRGGKMEDVIFAGTAGRPALGRAEVTLSVDNHDGALPVDYAEVSITRRMFRSGDSEYEINGSSCRLLDIQELLSDSGIGREMHVLVGQGQLESLLQARPEDRRGFIEEAAGVLKHRKRKEKALRKLEAMQANLTRLTDLTAELRRQLKPLGRQAEVAHRAATVQADLRDSRLRLLADELVTIQASLDNDVADETAVRARRAAVERDLAAARDRETVLDHGLASDAPQLARAQETWYRLSALEERFRGTAALAAERARFLAEQPDQPAPGRDPAALEAEVEQVRGAEAELVVVFEDNQARLAESVQHRQGAEQRLADAEARLVASVRGVANRREGLARLTGEVNALRTRATAGADEIARLSAAYADACQRAESAQQEFDTLQDEAGALDEGELDLDGRYEQTQDDLIRARAGVAELSEAVQMAERELSSWAARTDALAMGLARKDGAGALLAAGHRLPGVLGSVAALLTVDPGHEAALAAALGGIADAVAVASPGEAAQALRLLKAEEAGRAGLLVGSGPLASGPLASGPLVSGLAAAADRTPGPALPAGVHWAADVIRAPDLLRPALDRVLAGIAVVPDLATAQELIERHPEVRAVTLEGDLLGVDWAVGGSPSAPSSLEVQAAHDEAAGELAAAAERCARLSGQLAAAREQERQRFLTVEHAMTALHESDARLSAVSEQLGRLGSSVRAAAGEAQRLARARDAAERARDGDLEGLASLEERLHAGESASTEDEPSPAERDELSGRAAAARQAEMDVRLAVRSTEERVHALAGRAESLMRAAAVERDVRARAERVRAERARGAVVARAVGAGARHALARITGSLERAVAERDAVAAGRVAREAELRTVRTTARDLTAELAALTDTVHRDEVARAEQRMRIEQLAGRAADEHGIDAEALVAEYGPDQLVPYAGPEPAEGEPTPQPMPYDRAAQDKRARQAERDLTLLGKVNPLALEEFTAMQERQAFLATQLEDLRATRRDLMTVVNEVDERIHDVFASAYADTAREFEGVFATLFPGGEGRLVLTDPEDMLTTGIEVEARPPGKRVKRLSLLSGGERSLTAVALLVAIFRARPSPFYVLDEVEAALDDENLDRLLGLIEELRSASQLIIITHQKRTMEVADSLYGVAMRGDGISTVISQRLREVEAV